MTFSMLIRLSADSQLKLSNDERRQSHSVAAFTGQRLPIKTYTTVNYYLRSNRSKIMQRQAPDATSILVATQAAGDGVIRPCLAAVGSDGGRKLTVQLLNVQI